MKHRFYLSFKGLDYRPDVQIHIWPLEHSYHADVISDGQCLQLRLGVTKDDVDRISRTLSSTLEQVARGIDDLRLTPTQKYEALEHLAEKGRAAFVELFGDYETTIRTLLERSRPNDRPLLLQITSGEFSLPWDLIYPEALDVPFDFHKFWGFDHIISRIVAVSSRTDIAISSTINCAPLPILGLVANSRLPHVADVELPYFKRLAHRLQITLDTLEPLDPANRPAGLREFKAFLSKSSHIAHFACHGSVKSDSDALQTIIVSDDFPITLGDMGAYGIAAPARPLIFMNGCETGNVNPAYTFQFATYFLTKGARGMVATECSVPDFFAAAFTKRFYSDFLKGVTLSTSVFNARHYFLAKYGNPLGLIYCVYGPPSVRLAGRDAK